MADFDSPDVLAAIKTGVREMSELERAVELTTPLPTSTLQPFLRLAGGGYERAHEFFAQTIRPAREMSYEIWQGADWSKYRARAKRLPPMMHPSVWEKAFYAVVDARAAERRRQIEAEEEAARSRGSAAEKWFYLSKIFAPIDTVSRTLLSNREVQRVERERARLTNAKERAEQQLQSRTVTEAVRFCRGIAPLRANWRVKFPVVTARTNVEPGAVKR
ncbi:hypothetical protein QRX50_22520 [Amycolatopsis carbonis]|uniref:Uncharacterized protein n=1 Tax=Amycolatopsis carbonis TaxID=715471 RepID=A0A9Y2INF0_9PSEU|nr:hypothetical protein [Amycolatopsis sp. 2-15]WIX83332.1 hypothetical protein QRX50_22520 [Amycolatopsis sp. 2-15]